MSATSFVNGQLHANGFPVDQTRAQDLEAGMEFSFRGQKTRRTVAEIVPSPEDHRKVTVVTTDGKEFLRMVSTITHVYL